MGCREATGWTASPGCSATPTATATWTGRTATASGPRSRRAPMSPVTCGTSISTGTATWTVGTSGSSTAASAGFDPVRRSARDGQGSGEKTAGETLPPSKPLTRRGADPGTGLDAHAAGWGWVVEATPRGDSAFTTIGAQGRIGKKGSPTVSFALS